MLQARSRRPSRHAAPHWGWSLLAIVATGCSRQAPPDADFESTVVRRAVEFATGLVEPQPTSRVWLGARPVDPSGERFVSQTREVAALTARRRREIAALGIQQTEAPFPTGCSGASAPAAPGDDEKSGCPEQLEIRVGLGVPRDTMLEAGPARLVRIRVTYLHRGGSSGTLAELVWLRDRRGRYSPAPPITLAHLD